MPSPTEQNQHVLSTGTWIVHKPIHARALVALTLALIHQESATPSLPQR